MTPEQIRAASAEELIPALAALPCRIIDCNMGWTWDQTTQEPRRVKCEGCHGAGLALPGLSMECPNKRFADCPGGNWRENEYMRICGLCGKTQPSYMVSLPPHYDASKHRDDCKCHGSGRVPLQGAEAELALMASLTQRGEWDYHYCPTYLPKTPHEIGAAALKCQFGMVYGPDLKTALARAVALQYL